MRKVVIASACRTMIGKMGGMLSTTPVAELGATVIKEAVSRANIPEKLVEYVMMGCVLQAGQGQNVARQAALKAGIPVESPAFTLNAVCGSGMQAAVMGAQMIQIGEADVVVAGGMENMSKAPFLLDKARFGYHLGEASLQDSLIQDGLWCSINDYHMGVTAENIAKRWKISREEMDQYAFLSQKKAWSAIQERRFQEEIVPIYIKNKKGMVCAEIDENPRLGLTLEELSRLKPAFAENGCVTAGNASSINDGAAAIVMMSSEVAEKLDIQPLGTWITGTLCGVDPSVMGIGPIKAVSKVLKRAKIELNNIDLFEINEAFAVQSIAVKRELKLQDEKLNVNGGAIALGHPIGASGCRILVSLLYEMKRRQANTGVAALCIGGGMGGAVVVER